MVALFRGMITGNAAVCVWEEMSRRARAQAPPRALIAPICGARRTHTRTTHAHTSPRGDKRCIRQMYVVPPSLVYVNENVQKSTRNQQQSLYGSAHNSGIIILVGNVHVLFFYVAGIQLFLIVPCFAQLLAIIRVCCVQKYKDGSHWKMTLRSRWAGSSNLKKECLINWKVGVGGRGSQTTDSRRWHTRYYIHLFNQQNVVIEKISFSPV